MNTMTTDTQIITSIVRCDPRFVSVTREGSYVLKDDDNPGHTVTLTPTEYAVKHPWDAEVEFYATLDVAIRNASGTNITSSGEIVDTLLDLRTLFTQAKADFKSTGTMWYQMWNAAHRRAAFYEQQYGEVDIPDEWEPDYAAKYAALD